MHEEKIKQNRKYTKEKKLQTEHAKLKTQNHPKPLNYKTSKPKTLD